MTANVFPQSYPLWAVRACSIEESAAEVGLVVGWEVREDEAWRRPIVVTLGGGGDGSAPGIARDWESEAVRSEVPGARWVERVELYPTFEEASRRAPDLFREVGEEHDRLWPQDAPTPASHAGSAVLAPTTQEATR